MTPHWPSNGEYYYPWMREVYFRFARHRSLRLPNWQLLFQPTIYISKLLIFLGCFHDSGVSGGVLWSWSKCFLPIGALLVLSIHHVYSGYSTSGWEADVILNSNLTVGWMDFWVLSFIISPPQICRCFLFYYLYFVFFSFFQAFFRPCSLFSLSTFFSQVKPTRTPFYSFYTIGSRWELR